jgi:hypothetical protein
MACTAGLLFKVYIYIYIYIYIYAYIGLCIHTFSSVFNIVRQQKHTHIRTKHTMYTHVGLPCGQTHGRSYHKWVAKRHHRPHKHTYTCVRWSRCDDGVEERLRICMCASVRICVYGCVYEEAAMV